MAGRAGELKGKRGEVFAPMGSYINKKKGEDRRGDGRGGESAREACRKGTDLQEFVGRGGES